MSFFRFQGDASAVGSAYGSQWGQTLRGELTRVAAAIRGVGSQRVKRFEALLDRWAPHWLVEADAIARAADLNPQSVLLAANCIPPNPSVPTGHGCTSVLVPGSRSVTGHPMILKVRDEKPAPQIAGYKAIDGTYGYLLGANVDNLGVAAFVNDRGLVGANNTGSAVTDPFPEVGLSDCHVLRLLAERAADCDQAVTLLRELIASGSCAAAGYRKGAIYMLADHTGRAVVAETTAVRIEVSDVNETHSPYSNHFRLPAMQPCLDVTRVDADSHTRLARMQQLLDEIGHGPATIADLCRISRDTRHAPWAICNDSETYWYRTVSAFVGECAGDQVAEAALWAVLAPPNRDRFVRLTNTADRLRHQPEPSMPSMIQDRAASSIAPCEYAAAPSER